MGLDERLERLGKWVEERMAQKSGFASGFITATLVFCVGPMAVLGALAGGLRGEHELLFTKAMLDGFTAIVFTSTLGVGVLFSAVPILLYQGAMALSAEWITRWFQGPLLDRMLEDLTAVGGIMIIAIGLNLLNLTRIRVADWLPAFPCGCRRNRLRRDSAVVGTAGRSRRAMRRVRIAGSSVLRRIGGRATSFLFLRFDGKGESPRCGILSSTEYRATAAALSVGPRWNRY